MESIEIEDRLKREIGKLRQENADLRQTNDRLRQSLMVADTARPPPLPPPRIRASSFGALESRRALLHELSAVRRQLLDVTDRLTVAEHVTAATRRRDHEQHGLCYENLPTAAAAADAGTLRHVLRLKSVVSGNPTDCSFYHPTLTFHWGRNSSGSISNCFLIMHHVRIIFRLK